MSDRTYQCKNCGGTFKTVRSDEDAQAEAVRNWGVRGDAPDMAVICDDCYQALMAWLADPDRENTRML